MRVGICVSSEPRPEMPRYLVVKPGQTIPQAIKRAVERKKLDCFVVQNGWESNRDGTYRRSYQVTAGRGKYQFWLWLNESSRTLRDHDEVY